MTATDAEAQQFSAKALREWDAHIELVLRGLAHALNNRAASLGAVVELSRHPAPGDTSTETLLTTEVDRMRDLVSAVRGIVSSREDNAAIHTEDTAKTAQSVLSLHSGLRDCGVSIEAAGAPPVRVARWMLVRALVALGAANAPPGRDSGTLKIRVTEESGWVAARVGGTPPASAYSCELARAMGGESLPDNAGFRIPTLAELRRREGR